MSRTPQIVALKHWFKTHTEVSLEMGNAGLPDPYNPGTTVKVKRMATLINVLRNEGWLFDTVKDPAKNIMYILKAKHPRELEQLPALPMGTQENVVARSRRYTPQQIDPNYECTVPGCLAAVIPDSHTTFDDRFLTGRCTVHGAQVLRRRSA